MTFLVYGADGWIGKAVVNVLLASGDTVLKGRRVITIDDVLKDLEKHQPDFVICSLGRIGTPALPTADYLEQKGKLLENITCNMSAPLFIAQATQLQGSIPMLYIGTGCIFEYDDDHPIGSVGFAENEAPNFFAASYSLVKSQTDQIMKNFPHVMTARIRLPVVLDAHPRDLVTKLLTYKKIHSVPNSVTVLPDILPVLIGSLITGKRGVINAVNPGVVDHATIIRIFEAQTGKKHEHELVTSDQLKTVLLAGRSNTALKTDLITEWIRDMPAMIRKKYAISDKLLDIKERITDIITTRAKFNVTPDRERKILVTGGCGFIGSNFVNYWSKKYPEDRIINLDSLEKTANIKNIEQPSHKNYRFLHANLLDRELVAKIFDMEQPTHVVHFAAAGNVDQSFSTPIECTNANVLGTHTLLECLRILKTAELFVYISTDEVYGETPEGSNSEGTMFSPTNPYAASKAAAECLVMSYGKSYNIPYIITRANNVYGPYQYPAQVIPKFTMQLLKKQRMPVHGNGNSVRRFVHVLDKCRAIETIMHRGSIGGTYNIGTEFEISVKQIASILLKKIVGKDEPLEDWISYVPDRPYNDCRYSVNCSKLHALGWKASVSFEDGITDLVQWYKDHQDHW